VEQPLLLPSPVPSPRLRRSGSDGRDRDEAETAEPGERVRSSPLVRRIAKKIIWITEVPGTGSAADYKEDILGFLAKGGAPRRRSNAGSQATCGFARSGAAPARRSPRLQRLRWPRLEMNWCP